MEGEVAFIWGPLCARQRVFKKVALKVTGGHPCWLCGKESACQCRRHVFNPRSGNIPHASGQLSLCTATIKPVL